MRPSTYLWFIVPVLVGAPAAGQETAWEIHVGDRLVAPVVRGVADDGGDTAWLATYGALYRVEDATARQVSKQPAPGAQLQLAPGGEVYAWVIAGGTPEKPSTRIEIVKLDGEPVTVLAPEPAAGPDDLILGFQGRLIVTFAPLEDPEGGHGTFRYSFWNLAGELLGVVKSPKATPVLAGDGSAIALLTDRDATAFAPDGERRWRVPGSFRKGALSSEGKRAALNPRDRESLPRIQLIENGDPVVTLELPTPVHHLAITPDGDRVVAAGDRGRIFLVDDGQVRELAQIPPRRGVPYVFDLELAGPESILVGVLYRQSEKRPRWPAGSVLGLDPAGRVGFRHDFEVQEATGFVPGVDVRWGDRAFVGYTRETVILGRLAEGR